MLSGKAFVLLSGGIDSTTCLYEAINTYAKVEAVSFDYGQRHSRELQAASKIAANAGVGHTILSLADVMPRGSMLLNEAEPLPNADYASLPRGISPTYVPYRNGLMLSAMAALMQSAWNEGEGNREASNLGLPPQEWALYFGAHKDDAARDAYPDCSPEFIGAQANAIYIGTYRTVRLVTPLQWLSKWQVIGIGSELGVPFKDTWSCYAGGDKHCGTCPTCRARRSGFLEAGVDDPTEYAT